MIICFTGSHGSGKSTLAKRIVELNDGVFVPSEAGQIHERYGVTAGEKISFQKRLSIQHAILEAWTKQFVRMQRSKKLVVFDRCPADFAAYLSSEIPRDLDPKLSIVANGYVEHCKEVIKRIDMVMLVHPVAVQHGDRGSGKADSSNVAYMNLIHHLITGLLESSGVQYPRLLDSPIDQRVESTMAWMQSEYATGMMAASAQARKEALCQQFQ